jgi:Winged helix DNA-binding domain
MQAEYDTVDLDQCASLPDTDDLIEFCRRHGLSDAYIALVSEIRELVEAGLLTVSPDNAGELRVRLTARGQEIMQAAQDPVAL